MKKWMKRIGTLLAIAATILLCWQWPQMKTWNEKGMEEPNYSAGVLRVWVCGDGSAMSRIRAQAAEMEKANRKVRVAIRRVPEGEWLLEGTVLPDLLILETENAQASGFTPWEHQISGMTVLLEERETQKARDEWTHAFCNLLLDSASGDSDA